jgi:antitoxin ParD1/3/4
MGMNVNLTPQLEELVRSKVASGLYTSASEVVRDALRLMEEKDRLREAKLTLCAVMWARGWPAGRANPGMPKHSKAWRVLGERTGRRGAECHG